MLDIHVNHVMQILLHRREEEDISKIFMKPQMLVLWKQSKIIKLRETPKAFSTKFVVKATDGQVNSLVYGKNENDIWAIRSQAPKSVMQGYGEGSETRWLSVTNEGIAILM